jgi:hypothetical protein
MAIRQVLDNPALARVMGEAPAVSQDRKRKTAAQVAASGKWQLLFREVDRVPTAWIAVANSDRTDSVGLR